jgi:hypothetical protein
MRQPPSPELSRRMADAWRVLAQLQALLGVAARSPNLC